MEHEYPDKSRTQELRELCDHLLEMPKLSHFSPYVVMDLFPNEIKKVRKKYPHLRVDELDSVPNSRLIACAIYKR